MKLTLLVMGVIMGVWGQIAPTWVNTAFLETRTFSLVNNNQKTFGTYVTTQAFTGVFPPPSSLIIAVNQLMIVANSNSLDYANSYSAQTSTGFTHTLVINNPTVVWYLSLRYMVMMNSQLATSLELITYSAGAPISAISGGAGTPRTMTDTNALVNTINMADAPKIYCLAFLTGFTATSDDNYQINLTCSVTAANTMTIVAAVHSDTKVSALTASFIVYDTINLAISSEYFVQAALTTSVYGAQTAFFSPVYGDYPSGTFTGVQSLSTRNNFQLNISINAYALSTSSSSFYNAVPQFVLRGRLCVAPYAYYSTVSSLCYVTCPTGTYTVAVNQTCVACQYSCSTCLGPTSCSSCPANRVISAATQLCVCAPYFYEYNQVCLACHYSCLTCTFSGQYFNCLSCDPLSFRVAAAYPLQNSTCYCKPLYHDVGTLACQDICGDGFAPTSPCDYGATGLGFGCSATCQVEPGFTCTKDALFVSTCTWVGIVTLSLAKVQKLPYSNTALFFISVSPYASVMSTLATTATLQSNASLTGISAYSSAPYLVFTGTYSSTLEGTYVRVSLLPTATGVFSTLPAANVTFPISTNDALQLTVYSAYDYIIAYILSLFCLALSSAMLLTAVLFSVGKHKLIGNELFFTLQYMFIILACLDYMSPMQVAQGSMNNVMGFNNIQGVNIETRTKQRSMSQMGYSVSYMYNVNIMAGVQGLALTLYGIYALTCFLHGRKHEMAEEENDKVYSMTRVGRIFKHFKFQFFLYWTFFNLHQYLVATCVEFESTPVYAGDLALMVFCLISLLVSLLSLFLGATHLPAYTKDLFREDQRGKGQFLLSLVAFLLMDILLYLSITIAQFVIYFVVAGPLLLLVYLGCRNPFSSKWVTARYVLNMGGLIAVYMFVVVMMESPSSTLYLPFGVVSVMLVVWAFHLVYWGRAVYIDCKYGSEEQYLDHVSVNSKDENQYFKENAVTKNYSFLQAVMGNQEEKLDESLSRSKSKRTIKKGEAAEEEMSAKRMKWVKQMNEMKKIRDFRERTRRQMLKEELDKSRNYADSSIRDTSRRGVPQHSIQEIEASAKIHF